MQLQLQGQDDAVRYGETLRCYLYQSFNLSNRLLF